MTAMRWQWPMLVLTLLAALVFTLFPEIDPWFSGLFHQPGEGFPFNRAPLGRFMVQGVPPLLFGVLVYLILLWAAGRLLRQPMLGITGRAVAFLSLSLAIGPGLIVNSLLKEFWGRARPVQTTVFGGDAQFTPALLPTDQCLSNCSFAGGHAALGFWVTAFALLLPPNWRRPCFIVGLVFGGLMSLARVAQGKHFLSDVVFAGIVTLTVVLFLYDLMISRRSGPTIPPRSGS